MARAASEGVTLTSGALAVKTGGRVRKQAKLPSMC